MHRLLYFLLAILFSVPSYSQSNWPQAAGPNGKWVLSSEQSAPTSFSVTTGENIEWKTPLPEGGQSGIAVWEDRIFLTVMKPIQQAPQKEDLMGTDILAICLDANSGEILWERPLAGSLPSEYMYGFSDSSTPSPLTDGQSVWFYNASGIISCFDMAGKLQWQHNWIPVSELDSIHFPFNKQFEPMIHEDIILNMEPYMKEDGIRTYGWNYLTALDKKTGKMLWVSQDPLTHYNTPQFGMTNEGEAAVLIGRGGHHKVPEKPKGYSMISLKDGHRIWKYEADQGEALYHASWNDSYAVWFTEKENELHILNPDTGKLIRKIDLRNGIVRLWDKEKSQYEAQDAKAYFDQEELNVFPAWYTNILIEDQLYFLCFKKGRYRKNIGPDYSMAKVDLETGETQFLELPVHFNLQADQKEYIWNEELVTETNNIRGLDVAHDPRSKRDGWHWNFNGNPIAINGKIYFTTMLGLVYVVDAQSPELDAKALISVNDLGPKGKTWSVNTPSFANGSLYHRTLKYLIKIGE